MEGLPVVIQVEEVLDWQRMLFAVEAEYSRDDDLVIGLSRAFV